MLVPKWIVNNGKLEMRWLPQEEELNPTEQTSEIPETHLAENESDDSGYQEAS